MEKSIKTLVALLAFAGLWNGGTFLKSKPMSNRVCRLSRGWASVAA